MRTTHATTLGTGAAVLLAYSIIGVSTASAQSAPTTTFGRIANTAAAIQGQPAPYPSYGAPGTTYPGYAAPSPYYYSRGYAGAQAVPQPGQQPVYSNGYGYVQPQAQPRPTTYTYNGYQYQYAQPAYGGSTQPAQPVYHNGYTYPQTYQYAQPQPANGVNRVRNAIQSVIQPQQVQPYTYQYVTPR